jgi:putative Mg2+ transporter-C (MgtC) family protein
MEIVIQDIVKLLLSVLCGGVIGWERFISRKPAGFRTLILVCLGATLVTMISVDGLQGDAIRIVAGVMTGIGFLGAGAVIGTQGNVQGLTTAASIWVVAAIGVVIGIGEFLLALTTTIICYLVLKFGFIRHKYLMPHRK